MSTTIQLSTIRASGYGVSVIISSEPLDVSLTVAIQTAETTVLLRPTLAEARQIIEALQLALLKTGAPE